MSGVGDYLGSTYKGLHIPADVIMKNHYEGAGHVASASYKGDVGYIKISMQGGYADYSSYWSEMGTHDYAPDPYIVHTGLGNHDNINGPLAPTARPYGDTGEVWTKILGMRNNKCKSVALCWNMGVAV